jgi:hypothetical protein
MEKLVFIAGLLLVCMFLNNPGECKSNSNPKWKEFLLQGQKAIEANDYSYAFYKLRKAWLAVPERNLDTYPYREIRASIADAFELSPMKKEARVIRGTNYSMAALDKRIKNRDTYGASDDYSVLLNPNGNLEFTLLGLDSVGAEPICGNAIKKNVADAEWKADTIKRRQNLKAKMPIVIMPNSPRYDEILSLCQPIKSGETKEKAGFDVSPFVAIEYKALHDI